MSQEERIDVLEEQGVKVKRPDDCIFCHVRSSGWKHSIFNKISDDAVRKQFIEHGYTSCDHRQVGPTSVLYSNFVAGALLEYVFDKHLERQIDYDIALKIFQDKEIMIPAIDKEARDKIQRLTDGCLKYAKGEEYEYYKGRIDSIHIYVHMAKDMFK